MSTSKFGDVSKAGRLSDSGGPSSSLFLTRNSFARRVLGCLLAFTLALLLVPLFPTYDVYLATGVIIAMLFTSAVSFLVGFCGIPTFGSQVFYGAGAYLAGWLIADTGIQAPLIAVAAGVIVGLVTSVLIGLILRGRTGLTFGILTLAIGQAIYIFVNQSPYLFGSVGIPSIVPAPVIGASLVSVTGFYRFALILVAIALALLSWFRHSTFGRVLWGIRQSRERALTLGAPVERYQLVAFVAVGGLCGLAGALYALYVESVNPGVFYWTAGATPILAGLIGGIRSELGPLVGAVFYTVLGYLLEELTNSWQLVLAAIVLAVFLAEPGGLTPLAASAWRRLDVRRRSLKLHSQAIDRRPPPINRPPEGE